MPGTSDLKENDLWQHIHKALTAEGVLTKKEIQNAIRFPPSVVVKVSRNCSKKEALYIQIILLLSLLGAVYACMLVLPTFLHIYPEC